MWIILPRSPSTCSARNHVLFFSDSIHLLRLRLSLRVVISSSNALVLFSSGSARLSLVTLRLTDEELQISFLKQTVVPTFHVACRCVPRIVVIISATNPSSPETSMSVARLVLIGVHNLLPQ